MRFAVKLTSDTFEAEPGVACPASFEVTNTGPTALSFIVTVRGIDPQWVTSSELTFELAPGESSVERVFLKPAREPESLAAAYPFEIVIATKDSAESDRLQCCLNVKPFHNISVDIQPRRAVVTPFKRTAGVSATVVNLGNVEQTIQFHASDNDDLFAFDIADQQVTIAPGQQKAVAIEVTAKRRALLANPRLQPFTVTCRSATNRAVSASSQAMVEQRALITPGYLALGALIFILLAAWAAFMPKAPVVDNVTVAPTRPMLLDTVTIRWSVSNAKSVKLVIGDDVINDLAPQGERNFIAENSGPLDIAVTAFRGKRASTAVTRRIFVVEPVLPPDPVIEVFRIEPAELVVGDMFQITYKFNDAVTEAKLSPGGIVLDPELEGIRLTADLAGVFEYKIVARNSAGQTVERRQMVIVIAGSRAKIVTFRAEPAVVDRLGGRVTITWQLTNAERAELRFEDQMILLAMEGQLDFPVNRETTFKLIGYDNEGLTIEREIVVSIKPEDPPTLPPWPN
ncbi:MAG: hypothetical protein IH944_06225 [Armatimonadetes bacterium]|nr:hypothetical protein [Armatimonadota bacterium]